MLEIEQVEFKRYCMMNANVLISQFAAEITGERLPGVAVVVVWKVNMQRRHLPSSLTYDRCKFAEDRHLG